MTLISAQHNRHARSKQECMIKIDRDRYQKLPIILDKAIVALKLLEKEMLGVIGDYNRKTKKGVDALFLKFKWCPTICDSCPHGPYWYKAEYFKNNTPKSKYIGISLTRKLIRDARKSNNYEKIKETETRLHMLKKERDNIIKTLGFFRKSFEKYL